MSALALLYVSITPFLAKRYSEKGRYYAWLIVVIGLIIPFRPSFASAIFTVDVGVSNSANNFVNAAAQTWVDGSVTLPPLVANANIEPIVSTFNITLWQSIGFFVWLIGMVAFVAYQAIKHYHFVKTAKRWSEPITNGQTLSLFHELKMEMGIKRQIDLCFSPCVGSPMMIGLIKPQILLPTEELAEGEKRFILKHELVHYKRYDLLYKYLVLIATAIHWFNPAVHLMTRAISVLCETSCDTEVIRNTNKDIRQKYSETIIGVIRYRSKTKLATALSTNFYGGKKDMKNRISSIMDTSKKRAGAFILFCALILTLGTGVVVATANASDNKNKETIVADYQSADITTPDKPTDFTAIESGVAVVIEIPEQNTSIEMTYEILTQESLAEMPAVSFEQAVLIGVNAIYNEFDFSVDGLTGGMLLIDIADGSKIWIGNIYSTELTAHSDSDELFHFSVDAETGEVISLYMNNEDAPFIG
jgi:beta-lactamase regulating signal transducer with metallopeptidase domain